MALRPRNPAPLQTSANKPQPKKAVSAPAVPKLERSTLEVFDLPIALLDNSTENPNAMDEATFDELVEGMRKDGFDEPIHVVPEYLEDGKTKTGRYIIASGHHRVKAAGVLKMEKVPAIIKEGWDDDARKAALLRRNVLRGKIDPERFTKLYDEMKKRHDPKVLQRMLGITSDAAFKQLYKNATKNLPSRVKKQLDEAKEEIKSVDDLSSVLNKIFKEHGSELDHGFLTFSFGGKEHHMFKTDEELNDLLKEFEERVISKDGGDTATDVWKEILREHLGAISCKPSSRKEKS